MLLLYDINDFSQNDIPQPGGVAELQVPERLSPTV